MASNRNTYQQVHNVSIPRDNLTEIAKDDTLNKTDYRVFIMLLTELDGFSPPNNYRLDYKDPMNFKKIDKKRMADKLGISKDKLSKSIENLFNSGIIESGNTNSIKNGLRFTF